MRLALWPVLSRRSPSSRWRSACSCGCEPTSSTVRPRNGSPRGPWTALIVAVCDVDRTVVNPAPLGAFHLHELHFELSSYIEYHTGRKVQIRRSGQRYWA